MRKLVVCLGMVLTFAVFAASSQAEMVIQDTYFNPTPGTPFNGSSGTGVINLGAGLFPGDQSILDIEVSISFTKLADPSGRITAGKSPNYNEISFSLAKTEVGTINLIRSGNPVPTYTGSFTSGFIGADAGFDGVLSFKQSATNVVNQDPNLISAGTFKPATNFAFGAATGDPTLAAFLGKPGSGIYTLNVGDNLDSGDPGLVFRSFTVKVTAVPEPTSLACLGLLATAGAFVRRRRVS